MMEKKPLQAGKPFLFVNHAAGNLDARPHRHAVFTHVQQSRRHWKKVEDHTSPDTSSNPPKINNLSAGQMKWRLPQYESVRRNGKVVSDDRLMEISQIMDKHSPHGSVSATITKSYTKLNSSTQKTRLDHPISPHSLVREGNSDPFSAFAVPIDPEVNALMKYTRDIYLPGIQGDLNNPGSPVVQREWIDCISFLQDECMAFAHLARIASIVASNKGLPPEETSFGTQALVLRSKTMTILRDRLITSIYDAKACNAILLLLNAEIYARNFQAAQCHAGVLAQLLQSGSVNTSPTFLFKTLYNDVQRAAMSLTRPSFDLENWVPKTFDPIFADPFKNSLPKEVSQETMLTEIDASMDDFPRLKDLFATLKHCFKTSLLGHKDPKYGTWPIILYGRTTATITMGRLVNEYLNSITGNTQTQSQVASCISLVALLWMRTVSKIENVKISENTRIFAANRLILETLRNILEDEPLSASQYVEIKLWILYTGACIDLSPGYGFANSWYVEALLHQRKVMKLSSWAETKIILQRFLYTERLHPSETIWSKFFDSRSSDSPN